MIPMISKIINISTQERGQPMAKQKERIIRRIPADVDTVLRVEAARKDISVNDLVLQILTKEAKRLEKKGRG